MIIVSTVLARKNFVERATRMRNLNATPAPLASTPSTSGATAASPSSVASSSGGGSGSGSGDVVEEGSILDTLSLGLLLSPKRINVAMTRAKALAIVVGAPDVLVQVGRGG